MSTTTRRTNARGNTARASWRPELTRLTRTLERDVRDLMRNFRTKATRIAGAGSGSAGRGRASSTRAATG